MAFQLPQDFFAQANQQQQQAPAANPMETVVPKLQSMSPEERHSVAQRAAADGKEPPPIPGVTDDPNEPAETRWDKFINAIADPTGKANMLLNVGANLLAPRQPGVSQASHVVSGLASATDKLAAARSARRKENLVAEKTRADIDLTGARTGLTEAETGVTEQRKGQVAAATDKTRRDIESADVMDDLAKARAELARAQAAESRAETANASTRKLPDKVVYNTMMGNILFKNHPDKYETPEEAIEAWATWSEREDPSVQAAVSLTENLPFLPEDRVQPTLETVMNIMNNVGGIPAGASQQRLEEARAKAPPIEAFTPEDWVRISQQPDLQERMRNIYGADIVNQKLAEVQGGQ